LRILVHQSSFLQFCDFKLNKFEILLSVVFGELEPVALVNWVLEDKLKVRFQLQMHKFIWDPQTKGV